MTTTAAQISIDQLKTRWSLSEFAAKILGYSMPESVRDETPDPTSQTDHIAELLEKIDQGYIVEETGERAYIPRFARAWVKSSVLSGGWT